MDYVEKYYPDGCPVCGHQIKLEESVFKYICYNCNAHANCHKKDGNTFSLFEPSERFTGNEEHNLRAEVRQEFSKLFMERRYVVGDHDNFQTSIVNIVYPEHLVKAYSNGKEIFYKVKDKSSGMFTLMGLDNGEIETVPIGEAYPVSNREKSMVFLAEKMGLEVQKANLGFLDTQGLKRANVIITLAVQEARKKSLENY